MSLQAVEAAAKAEREAHERKVAACLETVAAGIPVARAARAADVHGNTVWRWIKAAEGES